MSMLVLCPTRGRIDQAWETWYSVEKTRAHSETEIVFLVDPDDPKLPGYQAVRGGERLFVWTPEHAGGMVASLNAGAAMALHRRPDVDVLGFVGDDNRFRTPGWDATFSRALSKAGGGVAYGNDLFWAKGELPTAWFVSMEIVRAVGYMALPALRHLYADNVWLTIGKGIGRYFWFPNVIIEHMHPAAGKSPWDESYRQNNSEERYAQDGAAFEKWRATMAPDDIARVRAALEGGTP